MFDKKIILASKSPRRSQLLKEAGFQFVVKTKDTDESYDESMPVDEVAAFLAQKKARAAKEFLNQEEDILLAADSVVVLDQVIYGKPRDYKHAFEILQQLSGTVHKVITGVCLLSKKKEQVFSGISLVHMEPLSGEEIDYYIKTCQPYDKAGSYGIQEWIGHCKISKIEGTYSNIMGLPVELVYRALKNF